MRLRIGNPEVMGGTHESVTIGFRVEDAATPVDAPARVLVDGALRATSPGPGSTRCASSSGSARTRRCAARRSDARAATGPRCAASGDVPSAGVNSSKDHPGRFAREASGA